MGVRDFFRRKADPNVTPNSSVSHPLNPVPSNSLNIGATPFHDALNSFDFYFNLLPAIWSSSEHRSMLITLFETKSGKVCMAAILHALNVALFPEQQKNAMMKVIGIKLIEDFNNENYSKLFAIDRVILNPECHILEIAFFDSQNQKMINKVEKAFLICTKTFSQGCVMTLEFNPILNARILCEAGLGGFHSNFGKVPDNNIYERLNEVILTFQGK